ncbi:hypothetical protein [Flavisolibacter nicotianae]|uniref:hypothetical protein n=1 Tax=Flavisolibacter nicotianae TaxID=2364882 RepID=UPI000EAD1DAB|nr:hypothetical protein [Flavisolibacter nicotianae]
MQFRFLFLWLIFLFSSCFLVKDYKQKQFTYTTDGRAVHLPMVVPKGYVKEEKKDTAGITLQSFTYPGGALLYAAYLTDTTFEIQPFDTALHQPQIHRLGGWVYKGQNEDDLFYREIRQGHLRFGYRLVPQSKELAFDSATNYLSLQKK